jgi:hypothetical protein
VGALMFAVIDWDKILEVIWVSLVAGVTAVILFSLVVLGSSHAAEARREGGNSLNWGALAAVAMTLFLGIVVFAITVILNK